MVEKYGTTTTVGELVGAGLLSEHLAARITVGTLLYSGAVVGSLMVAAVATEQCDVHVLKATHMINSFELKDGVHIHSAIKVQLQRHPEIFDYKNRARQYYGKVAIKPSASK